MIFLLVTLFESILCKRKAKRNIEENWNLSRFFLLEETVTKKKYVLYFLLFYYENYFIKKKESFEVQ